MICVVLGLLAIIIITVIYVIVGLVRQKGQHSSDPKLIALIFLKYFNILTECLTLSGINTTGPTKEKSPIYVRRKRMLG